MPRAALLSIHARVHGAHPFTWENRSLVQLWGPRFSAYVVAARDRAVFSLGRLPDDARGRQVAEGLAARLQAFLGDRRMIYGEAGDGLGEVANRLRYAATTGMVLIRWDGARQPIVWTVPPPEVDPLDARRELARRYLHVFGPTTAAAFARWAGIGPAEARRAFDALAGSLTAVWTPIGEASILTRDEPASASPRGPRPRHGSCPAATPTSSSREQIASSWFRTPSDAPRSGPRVSGRGPCSSPGSSSGRGDDRRRT